MLWVKIGRKAAAYFEHRKVISCLQDKAVLLIKNKIIGNAESAANM